MKKVTVSLASFQIIAIAFACATPVGAEQIPKMIYESYMQAVAGDSSSTKNRSLFKQM